MEDIGAAVERIMADPEFARMVKELGGDGGDLMEKLPGVMETLGPILGGAGRGADSQNGGKNPDESSGAAEKPVPHPLAPSNGGTERYNRTNAERLFLALRPYLGERRRGLVDRCVSVMKMGEILKAVGMTPGSGGSADAGRSGFET